MTLTLGFLLNTDIGAGTSKLCSDRTFRPACFAKLGGAVRPPLSRRGPSATGSPACCMPEPSSRHREYNDERPKKALGGLPPTAYAKQLASATINPGL